VVAAASIAAQPALGAAGHLDPALTPPPVPPKNKGGAPRKGKCSECSKRPGRKCDGTHPKCAKYGGHLLGVGAASTSLAGCGSAATAAATRTAEADAAAPTPPPAPPFGLASNAGAVTPAIELAAPVAQLQPADSWEELQLTFYDPRNARAREAFSCLLTPSHAFSCPLTRIGRVLGCSAPFYCGRLGCVDVGWRRADGSRS